eukprot:GHVT01099796.1.p1 GENE.GHVT01099796.1~~GHVT01099796.1.p1  ORF type:complete len:367 (+),score=52.72 GHVT01099796.1:323-1423(+)
MPFDPSKWMQTRNNHVRIGPQYQARIPELVEDRSPPPHTADYPTAGSGFDHNGKELLPREGGAQDVLCAALLPSGSKQETNLSNPIPACHKDDAKRHAHETQHTAKDHDDAADTETSFVTLPPTAPDTRTTFADDYDSDTPCRGPNHPVTNTSTRVTANTLADTSASATSPAATTAASDTTYTATAAPTSTTATSAVATSPAAPATAPAATSLTAAALATATFSASASPGVPAGPSSAASAACPCPVSSIPLSSCESSEALGVPPAVNKSPQSRPAPCDGSSGVRKRRRSFVPTLDPCAPVFPYPDPPRLGVACRGWAVALSVLRFRCSQSRGGAASDSLRGYPPRHHATTMLVVAKTDALRTTRV